MKYILVLLIGMFTVAHAGDTSCGDSSQKVKIIDEKQTEHEESVNEFNQKVRVITKWKTKVVYQDRIVYKKAKPKIIYKERVVYRDKPAKIKYLKPKTKVITKKKTYVKYPLRNSISLMGFAQRTKLDIDESATDYTVEREHEFDIGLMYQRDITRRVRFSLGGNLDGTGFAGFGFNF